jgi:tRNA dimethylallyltransferase
VSDANLGIAILGPTASGKTRLAISLAGRFHGEIISCDALQIYRGMDIGTAKVSLAERSLVLHHMLDIRNPDEDFSSGDYQRLAREALREIRGRNRIPFVVGGTGFYLRALIEGLFEGPSRSEDLRTRMCRIIKRRGIRSLHHALQRVDPESAAKISEADASRIIRALEVYFISGKPMSWWQLQPRDALQDYRWLKIGVDIPREMLYRMINARVEEMYRSGFIDEVRDLLKKFPRECHAFKAIGYRQIAEHLEGKLNLEQAIEQTKIESRHYAKRQLTWFRSDPEIIWLDGSLDAGALLEKSAIHVARFLKSQ